MNLENRINQVKQLENDFRIYLRWPTLNFGRPWNCETKLKTLPSKEHIKHAWVLGPCDEPNKRCICEPIICENVTHAHRCLSVHHVILYIIRHTTIWFEIDPQTLTRTGLNIMYLVEFSLWSTNHSVVSSRTIQLDFFG